MFLTRFRTTFARVAPLVAGLVWLASPLAQAQDYPSRPITLVVPYPPGSATDFVARLFQPRLADAFGQPVVVENRGGASTNIGTEYVARAAPDGYTVLIQVPNIVTNEFVFGSIRWKRDDFAPVGTLVRWSNVIVAGPSAPHRDLKQLLAAKDTASLNYGSPGPGSLSNLAVEMLKGRSGLAMQHVTYTGTSPMMNSLLGGSIQYAATNPANFMSFVRDAKHKVTPLVVLGSQRDSTIPDVPTLADFGIAGIESYGWAGLLVPAKTPPAVVARLNAEFVKVLRAPDIVEKLKANYLEPFPGTPEAFGRFMVAEHRKWGEAIKAAGIKPE
ncbi:tripartite tricarboxylate transporter substrate binding protein [Variovorax sp. KK3]|uniref:Bug family tripartite tricarboxylate transporter substrate binding protein n=1 Tax=Variovorax sp. KK3 TaxID=1855728 RepID=UPI0009F849F2|nr:tripartite tricarboxylate transporter substrate binding protein [Variovorax sp. KK3]